MPELSAPPLPPSVTRQQSNLQAASANQPPQQQAAQAGAQSSAGTVKQMIEQIGQPLEGLAKILAQENPNLLPILKPVVNGLKMLAQEYEAIEKKGAQGAAQAPPQNQQQPEEAGAMAMG